MSDFTYAHGRCPIERPPAPLSWVKTEYGKPAVPMNWHHVIPYSTLRDCWNVLARHQRDVPKAKVALHIYMRILGFEHEDAKRLMQAMADGGLAVQAQERIEVAVAYPKWDIVEGPKKRTDDPGDRFDEYSVGLSTSEWLRKRRLKPLCEALTVFNEATAGQERVAGEVFNAVANQLTLVERTLQGCKRLIGFRESMWEMVEPPGQPKSVPAAAQWRKRRVAKAG